MDLEQLTGRVIQEVGPHTMVPPDSLALTIKSVVEAVEAGRPGDIVECGTWKGGSSFAMLLAQRYRFGKILKPVWMLDSFQGLPKAEDRDGPAAIAYQSNTNAPTYYDNCTADLEETRAAAAAFGFAPDEAIIVPGWFDDTIPQRIHEIGKARISVLRIDCDWYRPVRFVLERFEPLVSEQGIIIIDDYFPWDGCTRAVHDYLSGNDLPYRIRSLPTSHCAWMIKQPGGRM